MLVRLSLEWLDLRKKWVTSSINSEGMMMCVRCPTRNPQRLPKYSEAHSSLENLLLNEPQTELASKKIGKIKVNSFNLLFFLSCCSSTLHFSVIKTEGLNLWIAQNGLLECLNADLWPPATLEESSSNWGSWGFQAGYFCYK